MAVRLFSRSIISLRFEKSANVFKIKWRTNFSIRWLYRKRLNILIFRRIYQITRSFKRCDLIRSVASKRWNKFQAWDFAVTRNNHLFIDFYYYTRRFPIALVQLTPCVLVLFTMLIFYVYCELLELDRNADGGTSMRNVSNKQRL